MYTKCNYYIFINYFIGSFDNIQFKNKRYFCLANFIRGQPSKLSNIHIRKDIYILYY